MFNHTGYSVYLSNFNSQKERLSSLYKEGSYVFTSFHVSEEYDDTYIERAKDMCRCLTDMGYKIIADVSKKTLKMFKEENIINFAKVMNISILRIDYGFSEEEISSLAKQMPLCVNASTLTAQSISGITKGSHELYAMHNFYPRPETGLDEEQFLERNKILKESGIKVLAFIPGDLEKRGPIFKGLPTLESHREAAPYAAFLDLLLNYRIDGVFVGDGVIDIRQSELIEMYLNDQIIHIPVTLDREAAEALYGQKFTIRADSPRWLMRLQESREYSCFGREISPKHCKERTIGSITIDNIRYQRYSGEIQIIKEPLPADEKANVIGQIPDKYHLLLKNIVNGSRICLIPDIETHNV